MSCGLRDVLEFERLGRPAVLLVSDVFAQAAAEQSARLGQPALGRAFIGHPVQDRTDDELREMARGVLAEALAALSRGRRAPGA